MSNEIVWLPQVYTALFSRKFIPKHKLSPTVSLEATYFPLTKPLPLSGVQNKYIFHTEPEIWLSLVTIPVIVTASVSRKTLTKVVITQKLTGVLLMKPWKGKVVGRRTYSAGKYHTIVRRFFFALFMANTNGT